MARNKIGPEARMRLVAGEAIFTSGLFPFSEIG
jgi:hypothetical protein